MICYEVIDISGVHNYMACHKWEMNYRLLVGMQWKQSVTKRGGRGDSL